MENSVAAAVAGIVAFGGLASAIWAILRLNSERKDRGKEEQRIVDKLEFLTRAHHENRETFAAIKNELNLMRQVMQEFQVQNAEQHNDLEKKIITSVHGLDKRIQQLELTGCKPTKA